MSKMTMPKFGPSEMFRLRHSLAGLVEELKFQKKCELDNESKIQELVDRNHALHKEWDTERQKARLKEEEFERAISELKLKYENKLRRLDIDRRQKNMKNECNLFAKDRMKEDMRQLQMTVFHQEKTIKELETKLQSLETSRETALCQWTGVEEKIANLSEIYQHTLDSVQRLQRDVAKAASLNRKLSYYNQHHSCLMRERTLEIGRLQQELLLVKIEASTPSLQECDLQEMRSTIHVLNCQLQMHTDLEQKQKEALTEQTERATRALSSLQTSQELVNRHLDNATKCRAEANRLSEECAALNAQCSTLNEQLNDSNERLLQHDKTIRAAMEEWQHKERQLQAVITSTGVQLQSLEQSRLQLEESNSQLLQSNEELKQQLLEAQKPACVSTSDISLQTGSNYLSLTDISLQVSPDVRSLPTQTSQHMKTTCTQTTQDVKSVTTLALPDVSTVSTAMSAPGKSSTATQTSRLQVEQMLQSGCHELMPSRVQADDNSLYQTSAQTIPAGSVNTVAADNADSFNKSLSQCNVAPHLLALEPIHGFLDTHEASISQKPAQTKQLLSESVAADQTPHTFIKSPSRVAFDAHGLEYVQRKADKHQVETSIWPEAVPAQSGITASSIAAHMADSITKPQPKDVDQHTCANQQLLDKYMITNEFVMCPLTAERTLMSTATSRSIQDLHTFLPFIDTAGPSIESPSAMDTAGPSIESGQDEQANDYSKSSVTTVQTVRQYDYQAMVMQNVDLPISATEFSTSFSYTQDIEEDTEKQFTYYDSTRPIYDSSKGSYDSTRGSYDNTRESFAVTDHVVKRDPQSFTAESRTGSSVHGMGEWKETPQRASSNLTRETSKGADRWRSNTGSTLYSTIDGDKAGSDGGVEGVIIKQETRRSDDVTDHPVDSSLQGEVCPVTPHMSSCDNRCCSSGHTDHTLFHWERLFDTTTNASTCTGRVDHNGGKDFSRTVRGRVNTRDHVRTDSNETFRMKDSIIQNDTKICRTIVEMLGCQKSRDTDQKMDISVSEVHSLIKNTCCDVKVDIDVNEVNVLKDSIRNHDKININETYSLENNRSDEEKVHINADETHIFVDNTIHEKKKHITVNEAQESQDITDSWKLAGRCDSTDKPSAFSDTNNACPDIRPFPGCPEISLSSGGLNVAQIAHTPQDNQVCGVPISNIPFENVGEDQDQNVVCNDILRARASGCGFGKTRPHTKPLSNHTRQLVKRLSPRVRQISLPQSVFIVNVHPNSSGTTEYNITYHQDGAVSIQENTGQVEAGVDVAASSGAQVLDKCDSCLHSVQNVHSSSICLEKEINMTAISHIQLSTAYTVNVSGSACLSQTADKVSSKQDQTLTKDVSESNQIQVTHPYNVHASENLLLSPIVTLNVSVSNQGPVIDPYDFCASENLLVSPAAKPKSSYMRTTPRSLKLAKPFRISGTASPASLKSPFLSSLGMSSSIVTRTHFPPSNTSSPDLFKSQPLGNAPNELVPFQVLQETKSSSYMIFDNMSFSVEAQQSNQTSTVGGSYCQQLLPDQTSTAGGSYCQQLLPDQTSQIFTNETSQYLTSLTSGFSSNQTYSFGSSISDKCRLQAKSSDTVNRLSIVCNENQKKPGANSLDDHINPPAGASAQKYSSPPSSSPPSSSPPSSSPPSSSPPSSSQAQNTCGHTPGGREVAGCWRVVLSPLTTARNTRLQDVPRKEPAKGATKLKGILKGPHSSRSKSVPSKSVRFPLELVHHVHDLRKNIRRHRAKHMVYSFSSSEDLVLSQHKTSAIHASPSGCTNELQVSLPHGQDQCGNSSLATDADPTTGDQSKRGQFPTLMTSSCSGPNSSHQHSSGTFKGLATESDTNTSYQNKYASHRSLAIPNQADPSSSCQFTHCSSTSLATCASPVTPLAISTGRDTSADESLPPPGLVVPESPDLQMTPVKQEALSPSDEAPASSQPADTIRSSRRLRCLSSHSLRI